MKRLHVGKRTFLVCVAVALALCLVSCGRKTVVDSGRTFALDTLVEIKVYHDASESIVEGLVDEANDLIGSLENMLSAHIEGSDVDNINARAGKEAAVVSDTTYRIIKDSLRYSELTDGLFDVTAGPLIDLWAIDPPYGHVPTESELDAVLPLIDYHKIDFLDDNRIMLEDEGMRIDLGAIAKGAIADEVKDFLVGKGTGSAMINLGGNILLVGSKPDGSDFVIGIQDPNDDRGNYLISIKVSDCAIVSSGDYERFFVQDGKVYHHILSPVTGFPADTAIRQVTIVAPNSEMADGLSTSVLLLGLDKGLALVDSLDGVEAIFVTKDKKIIVTSGLWDLFAVDDQQAADYTVEQAS